MQCGRWCLFLASAALSACLQSDMADDNGNSARTPGLDVLHQDAGIAKRYKASRVAGMDCAQFRTKEPPAWCQQGPVEELCRDLALCPRRLADVVEEDYCGAIRYERACNTCGGINIQRALPALRVVLSFAASGAFIGALYFGDSLRLSRCKQIPVIWGNPCPTAEEPDSHAALAHVPIECPDAGEHDASGQPSP